MGRKAGTNRSEERLREELSRVLSMIIGKTRGAQSAAAERIGISRQALSLYLLKKATPGAEILRRICEIWDLTLNVDGALITKNSEPREAERPIPVPEQLPLFAAISKIDDNSLQVTVVERKADSLDLRVSINFRKKAG
jgi:transcriptional regulator with XRE-family HTH domain